MPHSFSNCPLRSSSSSCLLITNHSSQCIVTATDEVLDLLGYTMSELVGNSIQKSLNFQLTSQLSLIPECTIKHSNGEILNFQLCIHQDALKSSSTSCLDYWLIRPTEKQDDNNTTIAKMISVIKLSPFGTIEQVQPSIQFKQSISELIGRPVMAFVYHDDVEPLCSSLSKICSIHKKHNNANNPLFIRWSKLPCLFEQDSVEITSSLNYDWMSFTLMSCSTTTVIKPICIIRPLQVETTEEATLVLNDSIFNQLLDYCKFICNNMVESANHGKIYITEFYHHVVSSLVEIITAIIGGESTTSTAGGLIWHFIKSNYITQRSLELTGLLDYQQPPHFKTLAT